MTGHDDTAREYQKLVRRVRSRVRKLEILISGWEGGDIFPRVAGEPVKVDLGKSGGMAVIVSNLPGQLRRFASARGLNWRIANVAPLLWDAIRLNGHGLTTQRGQELWSAVAEDTGWEWHFSYAGRPYLVRVFRIETPDMDQYLVQQTRLWGRGHLAAAQKPDGKVELDIYEVPATDDDFPLHLDAPGAVPEYVSTRYAMAEFQRIRYLIFSRAVARLHRELECDLVIANDYHVGLAPFLAAADAEPPRRPEESDLLQLSIWHNLGYQGIDAFYYPGRNLAVRIGEASRRFHLDSYAARTGIPVDVLEDYFVAWRTPAYIGTPNWAQAILRLNYHRTGLAGTTVSDNYARQLRTENRECVVDLVREESGLPVSDLQQNAADRLRREFAGQTFQDDFFTPNCNLPDLTRFHLEGVLNGMFPEKAHLRFRDDLLARLLEAFAGTRKGRELAEALGLDPAARWLGGKRDEIQRNLADHQEHPVENRIQSAAELLRVKSLARELLARDPRLSMLAEEGAEDRPIVFSWGRLVSQKAFHILCGAVDHITERATLIVLATAPASDREGVLVEQTLRDQSAKNENFVFINAFDPELRDLCLLAASVAPLTSLYEPCGLTDVEAYWFGTLCVVHEVGGLIKGQRDEGPHYDQIATVAPAGKPVAAGYRHWDNTRPAGEIERFEAAYDRLVGLLETDPDAFAERQLKALNLMQFSWEIPANRYIDLIQYTWFSQVWRWLKDHAAEDPVGQMRKFLEQDRGFVAGTGAGCEESLLTAFLRFFRPPEAAFGVPLLDANIALDRTLVDALG